MKRIICLITVLCLVLGSFSFCFASPTVWDTSDQQNLLYIRNSVTGNGTMITAINSIVTNTNTIANHLNTIKGYLVDSGHGIAYWVQAISTWMSPIYNAISAMPTDLFTIIGALGYYDSNNTYHPFLNEIDTFLSYKGMRPGWVSSPNRLLYQYNGGSGTITSNTFDFSAQGLLGTLSLQQYVANENTAKFYADLMGNWNAPYTRTNWTNLVNQSITPTSGMRGISALLEWIQQPTARLAYVLASDERIAAQEAAAANEEAVVDNFIDSSGSGSASPSDIGSISDLSSGYQNNFGSDASVSGIFNIFNSNNMGWFSQETANQLDTTASNRRGSSFETPLLDQQINDIYDQIGVKHD